MKLAEIERRLTDVELELARLKANRTAAAEKPRHPVDILDRIHGTFQDDEAFREAMRLGRQWRKSQDARERRLGRAKRK